MGKPPAFQFYPGDWFREPGLKRVDLDIRGAWAELLMIMWDEHPQGRIETHIKGFAQMLRVDLPTICHVIRELDTNKIADVKYNDDETKQIVLEGSLYKSKISEKNPENFSRCHVSSQNCHGYVRITNRRMFNAWKKKESERLRKQKSRSKGRN